MKMLLLFHLVAESRSMKRSDHMLDLFSWHGLIMFGMFRFVIGLHLGQVVMTHKINKSLEEQGSDIRFKYDL